MVYTELDVYYIVHFLRVHVIPLIRIGYINNNREISDKRTACLDDF